MVKGTIKGLTLWQPWAWCVAAAGKRVENRTWKPPAARVGEWLAIHAGQKFDPTAARQLAELLGMEELPAAASRKGAIVAVARLVAVVDSSDDPWFVGPVGWVLDEVKQIDPLPCAGAQGFWNLPDGVLVELRKRWAAR